MTDIRAKKRNLSLNTEVALSKEDIMVIESPINMVEGEILTFNMTWIGATSGSSPTATVYRKGTDYSSTAFTSGTHSITGTPPVQTLKALTAVAGDGGKKYVVIIKAVIDSNTEIRKLLVRVVRDEQE